MNVGETLKPLTVTIDLARMVAYAAASWDWFPTHYDVVAAAAAQLPRPVVDGQMFGALLARHALLGARDARVLRLSFRLQAMVFAGETVTVEGAIQTITGNRVVLQQRITCRDRVVVTGAITELQL